MCRGKHQHSSNKPAAGKAGMALLFAFAHHRPGLPEHYAKWMRSGLTGDPAPGTTAETGDDHPGP